MKQPIHLGQIPDAAILESLADFICGDGDKYPEYRSSMYLTKFFESVGVQAVHDGSTRKWWTLDILKQLDASQIERAILKLVDFRVYKADKEKHALAVRSMNEILLMENLAIGFTGVTPFICRGDGLSFEEDDFSQTPKASGNEEEFLGRQFPEVVKIDELGVDHVISQILQSRVEEIKACPKEAAPLALLFLMGSTLEGILLAVAFTEQATFMKCPSAPKGEDGSARKLHDWKLNDLINVSHTLGLVDLDVKEFSHTLRGFRNYIHPFEQMAKGFNPDQHTAEISWQVFRAAFHQLKRNRHLLKQNP